MSDLKGEITSSEPLLAKHLNNIKAPPPSRDFYNRIISATNSKQEQTLTFKDLASSLLTELLSTRSLSAISCTFLLGLAIGWYSPTNTEQSEISHDERFTFIYYLNQQAAPYEY